ncbi:MAG: M28 family peptidase [Armatimonadota bacterium]|nr:M28 family peptidase [bacterium]
MSALVVFSVISVAVGCLPAGNTAPSIPAFDEDRAFELLKKQVGFGPRYPGVEGHELTAEFIRCQLKPYADGVKTQEFSDVVRGKTLSMSNIIAHFNPSAARQILLAAHWDSRPTADMEIDPAKKKQPIPAANDGGSGVAVLLELARIFAKQKPDVGVVMVFFDGEDYGSDSGGMFLGSTYFAKNLSDGASFDGKPFKIEYGILLDMVGDKDLAIPQEQSSVDAAPEVVQKVWRMAEKMGYRDVFVPDVGMSIQDDHIPLIEAGVKCIDLIDFNYGPWHTLDDTPDKCSPKSLRIVGEVVANVIYAEPPVEAAR